MVDKEKLPKAIFGAADHPLKIGDLEIPCYVLEDGKRVLVRTGMIKSLGMSEGTGSRSLPGNDRLAKFIGGSALKPFIPDELAEMITHPLRFKAPRGGIAYGYEATILADICDAILNARSAGVLQSQQKHIAAQCEILVRGFARVGIIALVDEVTGYQEIRDRIALQKILEKYLLKEYAKWAKRFPDEFYELMFKLKGWQWNGLSVKRPGVIGKYTNDLVYERLAPGVLDELKRLNPRDQKGHRRTKHHQWLTDDIGHPALQRHLAVIIAFMRAAPNWNVFYRNVQRALPKVGEQIPLALDD